MICSTSFEKRDQDRDESKLQDGSGYAVGRLDSWLGPPVVQLADTIRSTVRPWVSKASILTQGT